MRAPNSSHPPGLTSSRATSGRRSPPGAGMLASLSIYLLTLALCLAAGVAMGGLLDPRGRWLGVGTPALGAAALVIAAYPLGLLFRGSVVAVLLPAAIALALALAAWQRRGVAGALRVSRGEALTLALGAAMGLVLLAPVLSIGFPTT